MALDLLHDYLSSLDRPVHLMGHSTSGLLGFLYAQQYPEQVKSLTLLAVGVHPAVDWQAHYYVHLKLIPCSRETILRQMVYNLFGFQARPIVTELVQLLEQDLKRSLSPHTLFQHTHIAAETVAAPLFICGSQDDCVITPHELSGWQRFFKPGDRLWQCSQGRYFFHYHCPQQVGRQVLNFWSSLSEKRSLFQRLG
jgi:pimeloyl-ACP methyl ester carboxylesterase